MAKKVNSEATPGVRNPRRRLVNVKVLLVAGVVGIVFLPSLIKYHEMSCKNNRLEEKLVELNRENKRLAEEKRRLETDITYIEKRAREEMGMVRKGEIVLKETSVSK